MTRKASSLFAFLLLCAVFFFLLTLPLLAVEEEEHAEGSSIETLFKWLNFVLVFGPIVFFGGPMLKRAFASMRQEIRADIDKSAQQKQEAGQKIADIEHRLSRLEEETADMRREASAEASAQLERLRASTQLECDRVLATAKAEIESSRRAARIELRAFAAQVAVNLAEQQIRQQLSPEVHGRLFKAFVNDISAAGGGRAS